MHVSHPLYELRRFVFVLQFKKAFNSDMNDKQRLIEHWYSLIVFLKDFAEAPTNITVCTFCRCGFASAC